MSRLFVSLTMLVSLLSAVPPSQPSQDLTAKFREADSQVTRLGPSAFLELPRNVRRELERRGCTIPQVWEDRKPHNVIKGEFTRKGQTDWAVLCSLNRVSSIFINASEQNPSELTREADIEKLQGVGGDVIGYSRAISSVGRQFLLDHYSAYGGPKPPRIDHQGIEASHHVRRWFGINQALDTELWTQAVNIVLRTKDDTNRSDCLTSANKVGDLAAFIAKNSRAACP